MEQKGNAKNGGPQKGIGSEIGARVAFGVNRYFVMHKRVFIYLKFEA
jgi:hypothetical protein